ncbi:hypothetical protein ACA910_003834 [Epithemia clementina (nom. ined.)]
MSLRNLGQFNSVDISALLSAASSASSSQQGGVNANTQASVASLLLAHQQQQQQQQQQQHRVPVPAPPTLSSYGLGALSAGSNTGAPSVSQASSDYQSQTNALLTALLQHQQREDQKKAALLQQLNNALSNAPAQTEGPSAADSLAMLLQHKQQFAQPSGASSHNNNAASNFLALLGGGVSGLSQNAEQRFGGPTHGGQLDAIALAKLFQSQQVGPAFQAPSPQAPISSGENVQATLSSQFGDSSASAAALLDSAALSALPVDRRRKGRTGTFPQKLHQMLSDLEREEGGVDIASFLPHGRAFAIHKPRDFVKHVMPKYFRMSRFSSFQRQLNLYDFQRITEGPDKGSYYHELFVQGRPILSTMMKRNKIKGVKNMKNTNTTITHNNNTDDEELPGADDDEVLPGQEENKDQNEGDDERDDEVDSE